MRAASAKHPDVVFAKVDTEAEQALAAAAGITSIPTLMAFRDKTLVFSQPGALNAAGLAAGHRGREEPGYGQRAGPDGAAAGLTAPAEFRGGALEAPAATHLAGYPPGYYYC